VLEKSERPFGLVACGVEQEDVPDTAIACFLCAPKAPKQVAPVSSPQIQETVPGGKPYISLKKMQNCPERRA
jgi:hypothetical protein